MSAIEITNANFKNEVMESKEPVLIDFWASWCGPCKMLSPIIEDIASEAKTNAKICKVNVDEQSELASKFNVMSIPTLVVVKEGKVVNTSVGVKSKDEIIRMINS